LREKSLHDVSQGEVGKLTGRMSALEQEIEKLHVEIEKERSKTARVQRERDTTTYVIMLPFFIFPVIFLSLFYNLIFPFHSWMMNEWFQC
jgi:hypothetical protein